MNLSTWLRFQVQDYITGPFMHLVARATNRIRDDVICVFCGKRIHRDQRRVYSPKNKGYMHRSCWVFVEASRERDLSNAH